MVQQNNWIHQNKKSHAWNATVEIQFDPRQAFVPKNEREWKREKSSTNLSAAILFSSIQN